MADAITSNGTDDGGTGRRGGRSGKVPRLPRWTRQEILVLIQGKKVAESSRRGGGRGRSRIHLMGSAALVGGGNVVEPKWASVSSYCRRHGVHRGAVQCRKRWSNLAGDFKKIREWEQLLGRGSGGGESYWTMRNDVRREKKLPGFFDREVYDILNGAVEVGGDDTADLDEDPKEDAEEKPNEAAAEDATTMSLHTQPPQLPPPRPIPVAAAAIVDEDEGERDVFDSARPAEDDGLFSDSEHNSEEGEEDDRNAESPTADDHTPQAAMDANPLSGTKSGSYNPTRPPDHGFTNGRHQTAENIRANENMSQEPTKRRYSFIAESSKDTSMQCQLIRVLDQNNMMLAAQLEAHNVNCQLEREDRKEMTNNVIHVLGKVANALEKMADKL